MEPIWRASKETKDVEEEGYKFMAKTLSKRYEDAIKYARGKPKEIPAEVIAESNRQRKGKSPKKYGRGGHLKHRKPQSSKYGANQS